MRLGLYFMSSKAKMNEQMNKITRQTFSNVLNNLTNGNKLIEQNFNQYLLFLPGKKLRQNFLVISLLVSFKVNK